jgi:hypothetical protein
MRQHPASDWGFREFDNISAWIGELRQLPRSTALKSLISALHQLSIELDAIEDLDDDEDADAEDDPTAVGEPVHAENRPSLNLVNEEDAGTQGTAISTTAVSSDAPAASIKVSKTAPPPPAENKGKSTAPPATKENDQPSAPPEDEAILIDGVWMVVNRPSVSRNRHCLFLPG